MRWLTVKLTHVAALRSNHTHAHWSQVIMDPTGNATVGPPNNGSSPGTGGFFGPENCTVSDKQS